jgi:hypothetical protein
MRNSVHSHTCLHGMSLMKCSTVLVLVCGDKCLWNAVGRARL